MARCLDKYFTIGEGDIERCVEKLNHVSKKVGKHPINEISQIPSRIGISEAVPTSKEDAKKLITKANEMIKSCREFKKELHQVSNLIKTKISESNKEFQNVKENMSKKNIAEREKEYFAIQRLKLQIDNERKNFRYPKMYKLLAHILDKKSEMEQYSNFKDNCDYRENELYQASNEENGFTSSETEDFYESEQTDICYNSSSESQLLTENSTHISQEKISSTNLEINKSNRNESKQHDSNKNINFASTNLNSHQKSKYPEQNLDRFSKNSNKFGYVQVNYNEYDLNLPEISVIGYQPPGKYGSFRYKNNHNTDEETEELVDDNTDINYVSAKQIPMLIEGFSIQKGNDGFIVFIIAERNQFCINIVNENSKAILGYFYINEQSFKEAKSLGIFQNYPTVFLSGSSSNLICIRDYLANLK